MRHPILDLGTSDILVHHPQGSLTVSRYNWISDRSTHAIHNLITSSNILSYLNLGPSALTNTGLNEILRAVATSQTLLFYSAKTIHPQSKSALAVAEGQKHIHLAKRAHLQVVANVKRVYNGMEYGQFWDEEKRWLVNDKTDVRKIDSVYRNRDAGMARRGLKKLEKWWNEDDETLKEVMKGAVGPVCTKRNKQIPVDGAIGPVCTLKAGVVEG